MLARRSSLSSSCCVTSSGPTCAMTCPTAACVSCFLPHPASANAPASARAVAATRKPPAENPEICSKVILPGWSGRAYPRVVRRGLRYTAISTVLLTKHISQAQIGKQRSIRAPQSASDASPRKAPAFGNALSALAPRDANPRLDSVFSADPDQFRPRSRHPVDTRHLSRHVFLLHRRASGRSFASNSLRAGRHRGRRDGARAGLRRLADLLHSSHFERH